MNQTILQHEHQWDHKTSLICMDITYFSPVKMKLVLKETATALEPTRKRINKEKLIRDTLMTNGNNFLCVYQNTISYKKLVFIFYGKAQKYKLSLIFYDTQWNDGWAENDSPIILNVVENKFVQCLRRSKQFSGMFWSKKSNSLYICCYPNVD